MWTGLLRGTRLRSRHRHLGGVQAAVDIVAVRHHRRCLLLPAVQPRPLADLRPAGRFAPGSPRRSGVAASWFGQFRGELLKDTPQRRRTVAVKASKKLLRVLTVTEVQSILDACEHLRDRFLFPFCGTQAFVSARRWPTR